MNVVVRFAPSPTGKLHLGNARVALLNLLLATRHGGRAILRVDDTDLERSKPEFEDAIRTDLAWLGYRFDETFKQSDRFDLYREALDGLIEAGRAYRCKLSPDELNRLRSSKRLRKQAPALRRADLEGTNGEGEEHWRFELPAGVIGFKDAVQGEKRVDLGSLSDPVLARSGDRWTYTMASVVDDARSGVTHVVRGEDHLTNTGVQFALIEALGAPRFATAHLPLLQDAGGKNLSKRLESLGLAKLRGDGLEPAAINAYLASLGTGKAADPHQSVEGLSRGFDLTAYGRAPARLDVAEIERLSVQVRHHLGWPDAKPRLEALGLVGPNAPYGGVDEGLWLALRGNVERLDDLHGWLGVLRGEITPVIEDSELTRRAAATLPEAQDEASAKVWLDGLKIDTGRKGKALFHPLRLALTARGDGPPLPLLLSLLPRDKALARLAGDTA